MAEEDWEDEPPIVPPPASFHVEHSSRILLVDPQGRRIDRAIGFTRRYLVRDPDTPCDPLEDL